METVTPASLSMHVVYAAKQLGLARDGHIHTFVRPLLPAMNSSGWTWALCIFVSLGGRTWPVCPMAFILILNPRQV